MKREYYYAVLFADGSISFKYPYRQNVDYLAAVCDKCDIGVTAIVKVKPITNPENIAA